MFKVSKSGYYYWLVREPSKRWCENEAISLAIRDIFKDGFESYGGPGIIQWHPNILNRNFTVSRENQVRMSDMTYIRTTPLIQLGTWRGSKGPLRKNPYSIRTGGHDMPVMDTPISLKVMMGRRIKYGQEG
ncbi:hypothetical protein ACNR9Q_10705 [Maribacter sp. X9]|uniref:hypothetical protein n=1 Tax=Maribacter sp. X9 TaxID=3402159 RepID=UPI003AF347AB